MSAATCICYSLTLLLCDSLASFFFLDPPRLPIIRKNPSSGQLGERLDCSKYFRLGIDSFSFTKRRKKNREKENKKQTKLMAYPNLSYNIKYYILQHIHCSRNTNLYFIYINRQQVIKNSGPLFCTAILKYFNTSRVNPCWHVVSNLRESSTHYNPITLQSKRQTEREREEDSW